MELLGRNVLIVGLGLSGRGAARLCAELGAHVAATDRRPEAELGPAVGELRALGVTLVLGEHRARDFLAADAIVISPGVPLDQPQVAAARAAGVPVIGELGLAASRLDCPVVAITGTNGKSTTTTFCGDLLRASGLATFVGGNLGRPPSEEVLAHRFEAAVLEVSSFQLESAPAFHPRVAAMLNCTEDHLDRYPDFAAYRAAKENVFANLGADDAVVYNAADPVVVEMVDGLPCRLAAFALADHGRDGAFVDGDAIAVRAGERVERYPLAGFAVPGSHNVENLLAAILCAREAGATTAAVRGAIPALHGLRHRMEHVRTLDGVAWFNDSKGTNVASTVKTLEGAVEPGGSRRAVLLLGGKDKGGDYAPLVASMAGRVRAAVLFGQASGLIAAALTGSAIQFEQVEDVAAAVRRARALAVDGDVVLLSPACSSYDQFRDFEHRGDTFRELVEDL